MNRQARADVTPVRQRTQYSWTDQPLGQVPSKATYITQESKGANYPEALIDLYWHEKGIPHQFQPKESSWDSGFQACGAGLVRHPSGTRSRSRPCLATRDQQGNCPTCPYRIGPAIFQGDPPCGVKQKRR